MTDHITTQDHWDSFWSNVPLPCTVSTTFSNDRVIAEFIDKVVPYVRGAGSLALEVGCAPGKWMVYLNKQHGFEVEGCEYVHTAVETTKRNLALCGVPRSKIHEGDFLSYDFKETKYDVVIALGFIEHFNRADAVISKMKYLLKPNGILILGIPKLTGLNHFFAKQVDKSGVENKLLPNHNLRIMNLEYFKSVPDLNPIQISYVGGFEPAMFNISKCPAWVKAIYYASIVKYHNRIAERIGLGWYSSYIMAAYQNA
jgi:SAM-dependent methyltransferase